MKLQEFFDSQKHASFTDVDKLDLYQSFLVKKSQKTSLKRASFVHAKYFVYTMIFVALLLGVYGVYLFNGANIQDYNRFAITSTNTNTARADYIAQVIDVSGSFSIEHDGALMHTTNIGNGDTILLKSWSKLVFEIDEGTQSKVIGPAKLIIQKTHDEHYKLNLVYGNYLQMEGNERKNQTIELAINDITVKQDDRSKPMDLRFIKNGDSQIFQNNGADLLVTKSNGHDQTTKIGAQQIVAIQKNDIKIYENIASLTKAIQTKNLSQTFTLATQPSESGSQAAQEQSLLAMLETPQIKPKDDEVLTSVSAVMSDNKSILDPSQDEKLSSLLYLGFITSELQEIETTFTMGDQAWCDAAIAKLSKRLQSIASLIDSKYAAPSGDATAKLKGLASASDALSKDLVDRYNVPPKYVSSLVSLSKSIYAIIAEGYGTFQKQPLSK